MVKRETGLLVLLIVIFLAIGVFSAQHISITYDEAFHFQYGLQMTHGNTERTGIFGDSNMPILILNAIPFRVAELFIPDGELRNSLMDFQSSRYATIVFSALVGLLVFYWARSLYGLAPACFAAALYLFDPNIIAHSQLVTTDIYAAGATLFAFYGLWRFANTRTLSNGLLCLFALGCSQLVKYSTIVLLPLAVISLLLYDVATVNVSGAVVRKLMARYTGYILATAMTVILMLNIGFFFNHTFTPFGKYKLRSDWFRGLRDNYPALRTMPVPLPYPYLDGLDWMRQTEVGGKNSGAVYLFGQLNKEGIPGYYFVAAALKFPITTQVIVAAALLTYFGWAVNRKNFFRNEIFLFIPISFYVLYFNFLFRTQIGIRYYLIVFPLVCVFAGSLFRHWDTFPPIRKAVSLLAMAYLAVSVASYYPYYLTYFNEFVWDRTQAYKYLADSNIDWGQSSEATQQYLSEHPDAVFEPQSIQAGHLVVRVNSLVGVTDDPEKYAWLRENFEPVATINNSVLIYRISQSELDALCSSTAYCK